MRPAELVLATGESFAGQIQTGHRGVFFGETVFNTGMVGYVEALTDPSYRRQILTFTYPLIGNYGVPSLEHWESPKIQVAGVVVSELAPHYAHAEAQQSLLEWCEAFDIPLISGVDTRALTKTLRHHGVVPGAISTEAETIENFVDINEENLVAEVSIQEPEYYGEGDLTIIAVDCGIKQNILRHLQRFPIRIKRVPYDYDFTQEAYDGVFLSNGPGDPAMCTATIRHIEQAMHSQKPIFGICLGAQLLARAAGAKTYKLPFGHRSQNQPCIDRATQKCYLTSANHGFAIEESSLPTDWRVTYHNLNDQTVQGIAHNTHPWFAVQFHPEANPGPEDTQGVFADFYETLKRHSA